MRRAASGFVLGFHGSDASVAEDLLSGKPFDLSKNEYDWLGWGAYFWESDPLRGLQWAELARERGRPIKTPTVVGAVIDLGYCLDLTTQASLDVIRTAHNGLLRVSRAIKRPMRKNLDELRRPLDCAVLNYLYESMPAPKFQTVRGVFVEGGGALPRCIYRSEDTYSTRRARLKLHSRRVSRAGQRVVSAASTDWLCQFLYQETHCLPQMN